MNIESNLMVTGRVQGVMFRQTFIRAAQKRNLRGAASNMPNGSVCCLLAGNNEKIEEIQNRLLSGEEINSWGAAVDNLALVPTAQAIPYSQHQVTTDNVDSFNWSSDVEMYL